MVPKNADSGIMPNLNARARPRRSKVSPRQGSPRQGSPRQGSPPQGSPHQKSPRQINESSVPRLNSTGVLSQSPQGHGPRVSPAPGLVDGHYAGCKFAEPPQPSALPLPPQAWMQTSCSVAIIQRDVTQMGMLLNGQA